MAQIVEQINKDNELIEAYQYTLAMHVEGDGGTEAASWSRLETPTNDSVLDSVSRALGLSSAIAAPKRSLKQETKKALFASDNIAETRTHWANYNIMKSLEPSLETDDRFSAASVISNVIRNFNLRRASALGSKSHDLDIMNREATKIERLCRGYLGRDAYKREKQKDFEDEKEWKSYEEFRNLLLGTGITVSRWSHSKKITVPCTINIAFSPEKDPLLVLTQSSFKPAKKYLVQDIHTLKKGYSSPFLRDLIVHKAPEKLLSLLLRDKLNRSFLDVMLGKAEKDVSIDLSWDAPLRSAASVVGGTTEDGKFARNKFFANFNKLLHEVESDDAFFFNAHGAYCRVGKSVFHRWEQVTFIDPAWENELDEDEQRLRNKKKFVNKSRLNRPKHKDRCFEPHPIPLGGKPQDRPSLELVYKHAADAVADGHEVGEYAATWFSWTEDIDYINERKQLSKNEEAVCKANVNRLLAEQDAAQRGKTQDAQVKGERFEAALKIELRTIRKERFVLQQAKKVTGGQWQAVFLDEAATKKKAVAGGSSQAAASLVPAVVPLEQLLPYFRTRVGKLYGDVSVAGWRNRDSGDFELTDENWTKLCDVAHRIAINSGKKSSGAADKLTKVIKQLANLTKLRAKKDTQGKKLDDDEPPRADADAAAVVPSSKRHPSALRRSAARMQFLEGEEDLDEDLEDAEEEKIHDKKEDLEKHYVKFKKKLLHCQKNLLKSMWEKEHQRVKRMWRAKERSYNTSEKMKLEMEKLMVAAAAAARIAEKTHQLEHDAANAAGVAASPTRGLRSASSVSQDTESLDGSTTSATSDGRSLHLPTNDSYSLAGLTNMVSPAHIFAGAVTGDWGEDGFGADERDYNGLSPVREEPPGLDDGEGDADDLALRAAAEDDQFQDYEEEEFDDELALGLSAASRSEGEGFELVVLEVSKKGKPRLPLGLDVVYFDLSAQPINAPKPVGKHLAVVSSKKREKMYRSKGAAAMRKDLERITLPSDVDLRQMTDVSALAKLCLDHHTAIHKAATCMVSKGALVVRGTNGKTTPSISSAYQNSVLCEDDYIVGVNGTVVADKDELIKLVSNSLKTRNLIVIRSTVEIPFQEFEGLDEFEI